MSAYQDLLASAAALGLQTCNTQLDSTQGFSESEEIVLKAKDVNELELEVYRLTGYTQCNSISSQELLQSRIASMQKAADTCRKVCSNKDALADRLRSAKTRPSVPVAPAYQQDFSTLLQHSASSAEMLHDGVTSLQWAATLDAKPSCWEDQLKGIIETAKEVGSRLTAMEEFSAALAQSSAAGNAGNN